MTKSIGLKKKKRIDFTEGPLFWRLLLFAAPIAATGILQMLYNATDKLVVGQFSGDPHALGAIGCTATLGALIINFMAGIGSGVGVVVAQLFGAKRQDETSRAVHTSLLFGLILSLSLTVVGYLTLEPLLRLLGTQDVYMEKAVLYLRITYIGIAATAVYNFGASILRATGDSRTPLVIGATSGLINVLFNLFFVCVFKMSVDGVAIATVISQYFSATVVILVLMRRQGESYQFSFKRLAIDKTLLRRIVRLGVPTGFQSCCFGITNLITVSAVNTFSAPYVTAFSVSSSIDGFLDVISGSFMHSSMNAVGQNYGAMKPDRIKRVVGYSFIQGAAVVFIISWLMRIFRADIAALFVDSTSADCELVIAAVVEWTGVMLATYFLQSVMNAVFGTVRGLGYSLMPLIFNLIGTCFTRIFYIYVIFPLEPFHSFGGLAMLYPVSWTAASLMLSVIIVLAFKKIKSMTKAQQNTAHVK
ncbi:MAG: MATE family efflux transporter [Clostridia bacterium]|nr:MATE family efflux transporter [Clostridia bacterium]